MRVIVEVVACTADDAVQAAAAGADRIELVSAISEGGLTPSLGTLQEVKARCALPIVAMLRPRGGGFHYSETEWRTVLRDAEALLSAGADGLVTGPLHDGLPHEGRVREIVRLAADRPVVFHRAFDLIRDHENGLAPLERMIELGIHRVLTSGGGSTTALGEGLRRYRRHAGDRLEFLADGGVRAHNVAQLVRDSGVDQVHLGPFVLRRDSSLEDCPNRSMAEHLELASDQVAAVVRALR